MGNAMSNTRVVGFPDYPEEHTGLIFKFTEFIFHVGLNN